MKSIITLLSFAVIVILFSFTNPSEDKSVYVSKYIKYSVEREGGQAIITLDVDNISQYDEIYLRRSDDPVENFRQVKYLRDSQIDKLAQNGVIKDKYPLPGNIDSYYKVIAISNKGIYKLFPSVKLSRY